MLATGDADVTLSFGVGIVQMQSDRRCGAVPATGGEGNATVGRGIVGLLRRDEIKTKPARAGRFTRTGATESCSLARAAGTAVGHSKLAITWCIDPSARIAASGVPATIPLLSGEQQAITILAIID